jgi:hypothetical protein
MIVVMVVVVIVVVVVAEAAFAGVPLGSERHLYQDQNVRSIEGSDEGCHGGRGLRRPLKQLPRTQIEAANLAVSAVRHCSRQGTGEAVSPAVLGGTCRARLRVVRHRQQHDDSQRRTPRNGMNRVAERSRVGHGEPPFRWCWRPGQSRFHLFQRKTRAGATIGGQWTASARPVSAIRCAKEC